MATWALIGCTKTKAAHPCAARVMYWPSALFRGAWAVAEVGRQQPLILSAKYGLLTPEDAIEPYDQTLNDMRLDDRVLWAYDVILSLIPRLRPGDRVVSYLGARYAEFVVPDLRDRGFFAEEPLKGLSQGKRLAWFKARRTAL